MSDRRLPYALSGVCAAAIAAFLLLPSGNIAGTVAWSVPFLLAGTMLTARFIVSPREARSPLGLLLAGALTYIAASAVWYVGPVHLGWLLPFPSLLDVAFFTAYALYAIFLLTLLRRHAENGRRDSRIAVVDVVIFTLAMSTLLWVAVVEPNVRTGATILVTAVAVGYPGAQIVLFALAVRLLSTAGLTRPGVSLPLFVWIVGELCGDVFYGIQSVNGTFSYDGLLIVTWMLGYTGLAVFATRPDVVDFLRGIAPPPPSDTRSQRVLPGHLVRKLRFVSLLLAALVPLVLAAVTAGQDPALMTAAAAIFALALHRASLLAGDLAEQRRLGAELEGALERLRSQQDELARMGTAVNATFDSVIVRSPDGAILEWNSGAERLYGYRRDEAVGAHISMVVAPADRDSIDATTASLREHGHGHVEMTGLRKDGSTIDIEASLSAVYDEAGELSTIVLVSRDVTERNALQRELTSRARRLDEAQRLAGVGSFERNLITGDVVWSSEYYRILGIDEDKEASYALYLDRLHPDDRASVQEQMRLHQPGVPIEYEARIVRPDGEVRWIAVHGQIEADTDGAPVRETGTAHDITDQKAAQAGLERLARTDALTGLANRVGFTELLQAALARVDNDGAVGLLLLDLDGFKDVNDGIGHHAGDLVLRDVAHRISDMLRGGDAVARLGGDEFAIVLPGIGTVENAIKVATSVRSCLKRPFELEGITIHIGGSIGVAVSAERTTPGALLKKADVAMYRAKTLPEGWAVFTPDQDDVAAGRLQMVMDLRATIERGDLDVAYQPILDVRSRDVSSFEALARWTHPKKGTIPPDQFIPLAEQAGLIVALTQLVLRKAAAACAAWRRAGHDVRVGVNLSVQVMQSADAPSLVAEALAEAGLDAEHLVLEITEGALATERDEISDVLQALRQLGVTLVIDDFGTGYSAMAYLKQLPVQELKIDRSFIRDIAHDTRDLAIVRSLIRLAHSLSLRVVAEGVETFASLQMLTALGCDFAQGYGIARPMPEAETAGWLDRYTAPVATRTIDSEPRTLLVVDDSATIRAHLSGVAGAAGWSVREATSAEEAIAEVERSAPDVIILDHHMAGMSGMDSVPEIRARGFEGPILLFTDFLSEALPSVRIPLDVWPISKANPKAVMELLDGYRTSVGTGDLRATS